MMDKRLGISIRFIKEYNVISDQFTRQVDVREVLDPKTGEIVGVETVETMSGEEYRRRFVDQVRRADEVPDNHAGQGRQANGPLGVGERAEEP